MKREADDLLRELRDGADDPRSEGRGLVHGLLGGAATYALIFGALAFFHAIF